MSRARRAASAIAAAVAAAVIGTGCAHPSAAPTKGGTAAAGGSGPTSTHAKAVKFAECMREHGVAGFPDPDPSGALTIDAVANGSSVDTGSVTWRTALRACQELQPPGFTGVLRTAQQQKAALAFARCVRANGVSDFPDPTPDGPLVDTNRVPSTRNGDLSALNAAMRACGSYAADAGVSRP